jgi:hypothetical protein
MPYNYYMLAILGFLGILAHNLMKLNSINRDNNGDLNWKQYIKIERFSMLLSICVVIVCLMVKEEIKQLKQASNWLGLGFFAIGYMSQSIIVKFTGKAKKILEDEDNKS